MQRSSMGSGLLALVSLLLPVSQGQEKKADSSKTGSEEKYVTKEKMLSSRKVIGKLIKVDANERIFTVQIKNWIPKENQGAIQNIANLQIQLRNARLRGDANGIVNAQVELAKNQANAVTYSEGPPINLEFLADDNLKVRTLVLPVEFDDKGKPRRLTEKEKKALKGPDPKAPGYLADFDSLKQGQIVDVYLPKTKRAATKTRPAKDQDESATRQERLKALMIVIRAEP
jgi:hypothetical protein